MWKLSIEDDQSNKTVVSLVRDEYAIGRAEQNSVRLTERNISRQHARLYRGDGGQWVLEDLSSYNGCYHNGARVGDPQPLTHGDLIQFGDYRLEVTDEARTAEGATSGEANDSAPSMPRSQVLLGQPDRLVVLIGPNPGAEYPLARERVVIGRGEECDISVNHGSVSRVHAEVRALGDGRYELFDCESANGVRVNGVELKRTIIDARDTIELGDVVFKFIPAGQVYLPGADESQQLGAYGFGPGDSVSSLAGVETRAAGAGIPSSIKVIGGVAVLGLLVVLGMVTFAGRTTPPSSAAATEGAAADPSAAILEKAKALLQAGDFEAAHQLVLSQIPAESNARQSEDFKAIEARWADSVLAQADTASDASAKRALLDRIAKATTVDSVRRKRASTEMEALDSQAGGVEVTELPSAPQRVLKPDDRPRPVAASSGGLVRTNPFDTPSAGAKPGVAKPAPAPTNPSGSNVKDQATSGDRAAQIASKNALKAKVAHGTATDQEKRLLRALCRQTGDMSCAY